jgi:hypothetical protein
MNRSPLVPRIITATSATALVTASAGFGAFYAWTTGSHHGPLLGGLSVLMALGLEGAKPFAIEGVLAALRSWAPIRAAALATLGTVAVAYSLTAELSLMAATRADTAAQRTQARDVVAAAKARYATAQRELELLAMTRPVAAINAEIARLRTTRGLVPCDDTAAHGHGPTTRRICAQIAALSVEGATSARRDELQATLRNAERDLASAPLATDADPAASALVAFLAAAGVPSDAGTLSKWLALVPVLALEVGSALAVVLTGGTPAGRVPSPKKKGCGGTRRRQRRYMAPFTCDGPPGCLVGAPESARREHPRRSAWARKGSWSIHDGAASRHPRPGGSRGCGAQDCSFGD